MIAAYQIDPKAIEVLASRNIPHMFVKNYPDNAEGIRLAIDYGRAGEEAVRHLAGLGHRKFGLLYGGDAYPSSAGFQAQRVRGVS